MKNDIKIRKDGKNFYFEKDGKRVSVNYRNITLLNQGFIIEVHDNSNYYIVCKSDEEDALLKTVDVVKRVLMVNNGYALCENFDHKFYVTDCYGTKYPAILSIDGVLEEIKEDISNIFKIPFPFYFLKDDEENLKRFERLKTTVLDRTHDKKYQSLSYGEKLNCDALIYNFLANIEKEFNINFDKNK